MLVQTLGLGATLLAVGVAAHPSEDPITYLKRDASPGVVISKCSSPDMLAMAYDDGPYQYTSELVDILNEGGAKATFFWTGATWDCIYNQAEGIKKAYATGHQVASHTWSHTTMGAMNESEITNEMAKVEQALVNLVGIKPAYMRPPYLDVGGVVLPTLKKLGYKVITDDIDTNDWAGKTPAESEQLFVDAGPGGNGHITLMHEVYETTVRELTPWIINWAKENNLKLVTVAECLGDADGMYQKGNFTTTPGPYSCW